jgi:hypothetical protein
MRVLRSVLGASALVLLNAVASGATINVGNPSFEDDSGTVYPAPWDWGGPAQTSPSTLYGTAPTPDGSALVCSMSNSTGGPHPGLSDVGQTLSVLALPNTTYTLTVDAINANGANPLYPIKLVPLLRHADGSPLGGTAANGTGTPSASPTLLSTTWAQNLTFTWTTNATELGTQALRLSFTTDNTQPGGTLFFDNVRLADNSPVPEPSSLALVAGLLSCGFLRRR